MTRSLSFLSLALVVALFFTGCSDQATPTAALQHEAAHAHSRCVWDGNTDASLKCSDKINVH